MLCTSLIRADERGALLCHRRHDTCTGMTGQCIRGDILTELSAVRVWIMGDCQLDVQEIFMEKMNLKTASH